MFAVSDQLMPSVSSRKVFKEFKPKLISSLPLNDVTFVSIIVNKFFISGKIATTMEAQKTETDKALYFLNSVICHDIEKHFIELLKVMEIYGDNLESLACEIKERLRISEYTSFYTL